MVKGGEVYVATEKCKPHEFDLTKNRPRLIANPFRNTLGLPQAISSIVQNHLKRIESFVCGKNLVELAAKIQEHDHLDTVICIDGSAFDSN